MFYANLVVVETHQANSGPTSAVFSSLRVFVAALCSSADAAAPGTRFQHRREHRRHGCAHAAAWPFGKVPEHHVPEVDPDSRSASWH